MEIERKFTIKELPHDLDSYPYHEIEQAYLNTSPVIRIRKEDDNYYLTYKGGGLMAREEYNLPLDEASYQHLLPKADGNIISKKRYLIPLPQPSFAKGFVPEQPCELTIELDIFTSPIPLVMAEVEFSSIDMANAFLAPDWFDEDVTNNSAYHNSNMSRLVINKQDN